MAKRIAILVSLILVPLFLTGCGLKKSVSNSPAVKPKTAKSTSPVSSQLLTESPTDDPVATYLTFSPDSLSSKINATTAEAQQKAKIWRVDANLVHFSAKFSADLGQVTETYTFGSAADAYNWWTIAYSEETGKSVRALIPKEDYLGTNLLPIPTKFWKINYVEALQLADTNGGSDYRQSHLEYQVITSLAVGQPKNYLWWTVEYTAKGVEPLKILINPSSKEVIDEKGQPLEGSAEQTAQPSVAPTALSQPSDSSTTETVTP